ncbi:hypothetical protein DXA92_08240 [Agathobaculum butyriciproducens]|nr:hypothetical protein DXA94_03125 [Agathobaculum butyriciproducens]RGC60914.1 hypothetical protein DXA92_08240 [Agathobaculum butyriciproducens]
MDIITLAISFTGIIVAFIVGICQIYLAKKMKDFEMRQDTRDELRRQDEIYAKATYFIQKYSKNNRESEILLLPFCVSAYKYNPTFPYHRKIYREFCYLTEEVQNEILKRQEINLLSVKCKDFYSDILHVILKNNKICYPNDSDERLFHDDAKYLHQAILSHGSESIPDDLRCPIDADETLARQSPSINAMKASVNDMPFEEHITNLLAYHKDETPLSALFLDFQSNSETIASYICCLIAKYTAIYNGIPNKTNESHEYPYDYIGQLYMEDLFLDVLYSVENYKV